MSITLTHAGTTLALSDRLIWSDEYEWSAVAQSTVYSTNGAMLVDVAVMQAGRPITLDGTDTNAWLSRSTCDALHAWAAVPAAVFTLVLRGVSRQVIFAHDDSGRGGFDAQPVWRLLDSELSGDVMYRPTFKFLEI